MNENYILELLRMPQTELAKLAYTLKRENADLEGTLFYARATANIIIENQRVLITHLAEEVDRYRDEIQNETATRDGKRHTLRFSFRSFSISLSMPRIWQKLRDLS